MAKLLVVIPSPSPAGLRLSAPVLAYLLTGRRDRSLVGLEAIVAARPQAPQ